MPTFARSFAPITSKKLADFEQRTRLCLPQDYQHFLLGTNGGIPSPNSFLVPECGEAIADILYGLSNPTAPCDLDYELAQSQLYDPLPEGFLPIGRDPGGNTLLLATCGEYEGQVFFWDRGGLWRRDGQNTFFVASSFTEFLNSLS
jgi:hypothetical protein